MITSYGQNVNYTGATLHFTVLSGHLTISRTSPSWILYAKTCKWYIE